MEAKIIKRYVDKMISPMLINAGFQKYKNNSFIREKNDLFHIVNFAIRTNSIKCSISIQPCFYPTEDVILSFGNRLNHFRNKGSGAWGNKDTTDLLINDLCEIKGLIEKNAMAWFDEVSDVPQLLKYIDKKKYKSDMLCCPSFLIELYAAYCRLYLKDYEKAKKHLKEFINIFKDDNRPRVLQEKNMYQTYIELIERKEYDKIIHDLENSGLQINM